MGFPTFTALNVKSSMFIRKITSCREVKDVVLHGRRLNIRGLLDGRYGVLFFPQSLFLTLSDQIFSLLPHLRN